MKNDFDIKVDVSENAVLVNDMEKWVINRRMIKKSDSWVAGYDPNDKTSSYRI